MEEHKTKDTLGGEKKKLDRESTEEESGIGELEWIARIEGEIEKLEIEVDQLLEYLDLAIGAKQDDKIGEYEDRIERAKRRLELKKGGWIEGIRGWSQEQWIGIGDQQYTWKKEDLLSFMEEQRRRL